MVTNLVPDLPDLSTLSQLSQATAERFKNVNQRLIEFEKQLCALNLGVEGWVENTPLHVRSYESLKDLMPSNHGSPAAKVKAGGRTVLGFAKSDRGNFRLFCKTAYTNDPVKLVDERIPLLEAAIDLRIAAIGQLGNLVSVLEEEARTRLAEIDKKMASVKK